MVNSMPLVSVVIPMYNSEKYICDSVESVLRQDYKNIEIILIDDGSVDNTVQVVEKFINKKNRLLKQSNKGPASARNLGIQYSNGDYIAFLDSDDLWEQEKIKKQINLIFKNDNIGLCYTLYSNINSIGNKIHKNLEKLCCFDECTFSDIVYFNPIATPSVLIPRNILNHVGLFEESFFTGEDLHLWWRISLNYRIVCVNEYLVKVRSHDNRTTNVVRFNSGAVDALKNIYNQDVSEVKKEIIEKAISFHNKRKAKELIYLNYTKESRPFIIESFKYNKKIFLSLSYLLFISFLPSKIIVFIKKLKTCFAAVLLKN